MHPDHLSSIRQLLLIAGMLLMTGCASTPITDVPAAARHQQAADIAASMVGKPYRYGGYSPTGFDCSGLVYYSYKKAGMNVPRSTTHQRRQTHEVPNSGLARGDLLFFNQNGKPSSHVGIYLGGKRFVHAPSSGKHVRIDSIADSYWKKHLIDVRRF